MKLQNSSTGHNYITCSLAPLARFHIGQIMPATYSWSMIIEEIWDILSLRLVILVPMFASAHCHNSHTLIIPGIITTVLLPMGLDKPTLVNSHEWCCCSFTLVCHPQRPSQTVSGIFHTGIHLTWSSRQSTSCLSGSCMESSCDWVHSINTGKGNNNSIYCYSINIKYHKTIILPNARASMYMCSFMSSFFCTSCYMLIQLRIL